MNLKKAAPSAAAPSEKKSAPAEAASTNVAEGKAGNSDLILGIAATVGGLVPEEVAAFTNMVVPGGERSTAEQVTIILERMMARRGLELLEADCDLLRTLAASPPGT
jgi:hypothetical protein